MNEALMGGRGVPCQDRRDSRAVEGKVVMLSAGILMWRRRASGRIEVLLGHFGGPLWAKRDAGAWAIPKGLIEDGESAEQAARREFAEEIGTTPEGPLTRLGRIRQTGGKWVEAFALEGDLDADAIVSNDFTLEWPPKSGRFASHPEIDRAAWFGLVEAREKMLPSQVPILDLFAAAAPQN
jgi:predicted NUDIX family NTP pyrophosphohydrolase